MIFVNDYTKIDSKIGGGQSCLLWGHMPPCSLVAPPLPFLLIGKVKKVKLM